MEKKWSYTFNYYRYTFTLCTHALEFSVGQAEGAEAEKYYKAPLKSDPIRVVKYVETWEPRATEVFRPVKRLQRLMLSWLMLTMVLFHKDWRLASSFRIVRDDHVTNVLVEPWVFERSNGQIVELCSSACSWQLIALFICSFKFFPCLSLLLDLVYHQSNKPRYIYINHHRIIHII